MVITDQYRTHLRSVFGDVDLSPAINPWAVPILGSVLVLALFAVVPIVHLETGVHLLALVALALVGYVVAIVAADRAVAGLIAGVFVLAATSANVPLVRGATNRADLEVWIADPFLAALLILSAWWLYTGQIRRPRGLVVVALAGAWTVWAFLAAAFGAGPEPATAAFFAVSQAKLVLYLLAGLCIAQTIPLRPAVVTVALAGVAHAVVAVCQSLVPGGGALSYLGTAPINNPPTMLVLGRTVESGYPIGGFAGPASALASITLLSLAVCWYYLARGSTRQRALALLGLPPILYHVAVSSSDSAIIMTGFVTVAMTAVLSWRRLPRRIRRTFIDRRRTVVVSGATVALVGTLIAWLVGVEYLVGTFVPGADGSNFDSRVTNYTAAAGAARESPLFGLGGANFEFVSEAYGATRPIAAHSFVFEFLAGTGVVGLVLHLAALGGVAWYARAALRRRDIETELVALVCVWGVAFLTISFLSILWSRQTGYSVFWFLAGMVVSLGATHSNRHRGSPPL